MCNIHYIVNISLYWGLENHSVWFSPCSTPVETQWSGMMLGELCAARVRLCSTRDITADGLEPIFCQLCQSVVPIKSKRSISRSIRTDSHFLAYLKIFFFFNWSRSENLIHLDFSSGWQEAGGKCILFDPKVPVISQNVLTLSTTFIDNQNARESKRKPLGGINAKEKSKEILNITMFQIQFETILVFKFIMSFFRSTKIYKVHYMPDSWLYFVKTVETLHELFLAVSCDSYRDIGLTTYSVCWKWTLLIMS